MQYNLNLNNTKIINNFTHAVDVAHIVGGTLNDGQGHILECTEATNNSGNFGFSAVFADKLTEGKIDVSANANLNTSSVYLYEIVAASGTMGNGNPYYGTHMTFSANATSALENLADSIIASTNDQAVLFLMYSSDVAPGAACDATLVMMDHLSGSNHVTLDELHVVGVINNVTVNGLGSVDFA